MKKLFWIFILSPLLLIIFVGLFWIVSWNRAISGSKKIQKKFEQVQVNWSESKVIDLLGKPDYIQPISISNKKLCIWFGYGDYGLGHVDYNIFFDSEQKVTTKTVNRGS